jgi:hypothetical protein
MTKIPKSLLKILETSLQEVKIKSEPPDADALPQPETGKLEVKAELEEDELLPPQKRACLLLPEDDPATFAYAVSAAREVGVRIGGHQEEIAPGIFYPAAQKLIVRVSMIMS